MKCISFETYLLFFFFFYFSSIAFLVAILTLCLVDARFLEKNFLSEAPIQPEGGVFFGVLVCKSDYDCPVFAPFCSLNGFCENLQGKGRKRNLLSLTLFHKKNKICKFGCTYNSLKKVCVKGRKICE